MPALAVVKQLAAAASTPAVDAAGNVEGDPPSALAQCFVDEVGAMADHGACVARGASGRER